MKPIKNDRKQLVALLLCAALLTVAVGVGKSAFRKMENQGLNCKVTSTGINVETRSLGLDITVTLREGETNRGVVAQIGDDYVGATLIETDNGVFTANLQIPLDPMRGFQLYLTDETLNPASIQEKLQEWDYIRTLLPVHLKKSLTTTPRFKAGSLWNGTITTKAEDIQFVGAEDGSCTVELRVYRNGTLAQTAPGVWDTKSGLYNTETIEVPCSLKDSLRLVIACRDDQNMEYEYTISRWEITPDGNVLEKPNLEEDMAPTLIWP